MAVFKQLFTMKITFVVCLIIIQFSTVFGLDLNKSLETLKWRKVIIAKNDTISKVFMNTLKNIGIFWRADFALQEYSKEMIENNVNIIFEKSQHIPKILYKQPFSVLLNEENIRRLDQSKGHFGFILARKNTLEKCYHLRNEKHQILKCFNPNEKILSFDGFTLRAIFSDAAYEDYKMTKVLLEPIIKKLNFTLDYEMANEPQNWGTNPIENCNYTMIECFVGLYNQLVTEKFDLGINLWAIILERTLTTDFLDPIIDNFSSLYLDEEHIPKKVDWLFYLRPFQGQSWIVVIITFLVFFTLRLIYLKYSARSGRGISFLGWLLYLVIFAYYSGAQTMFLSTQANISIKNLEDAVKSPDWTVIVPKGYELIFARYANEGKKTFIDFKNTIDSGKYPFLYNTVDVSKLKSHNNKTENFSFLQTPRTD